MSRSPRLRTSRFRLQVTQRLRRSWTRWRLSRTLKAETKAERRLQLLELERTHQHLLLKELAQQRASLQHRQQELQEAQSFLTALPAPAQPLSLKELLGPAPER